MSTPPTYAITPNTTYIRLLYPNVYTGRNTRGVYVGCAYGMTTCRSCITAISHIIERIKKDVKTAAAEGYAGWDVQFSTDDVDAADGLFREDCEMYGQKGRMCEHGGAVSENLEEAVAAQKDILDEKEGSEVEPCAD